MKNLGLAKYRKEGKLVYYSLVDDHDKAEIIHEKKKPFWQEGGKGSFSCLR
ncbi:hypothetical protein G3A_21885 [Bacillus sp. 17376]|uniref:Cadmium efflux system accessory protein n=1 Tax=Mesobacillus boroniphilus JCM 21738 TaxID=1294265 RepID=W4RU87_9BACI|nr:hypothetical protein G3A_21885 [Bacillus sp. 17376]GAE47224.1 cadmium efflux system accessory protein [Mesobacillus boroniphilus JCM 21738]